jgi:hypothetical protein
LKYLMGFVSLALLLALLAPGHLFTEDLPRQSDAVVLFVGPENEARMGMAQQLIREGYARYLIIPSSGGLFRVNSGGALVLISGNPPCGNLPLWGRMTASHRSYYENTHVEALEARRMLDQLGLRSALLVSSGYHMRRIRLISGRVFAAEKYSVRCTPARWQRRYGAADWLNGERRRIIASEYLKIAWFLLYGLAGSG